jgi:hypothetical protein
MRNKEEIRYDFMQRILSLTLLSTLSRTLQYRIEHSHHNIVFPNVLSDP